MTFLQATPVVGQVVLVRVWFKDEDEYSARLCGRVVGVNRPDKTMVVAVDHPTSDGYTCSYMELDLREAWNVTLEVKIHPSGTPKEKWGTSRTAHVYWKPFKAA